MVKSIFWEPVQRNWNSLSLSRLSCVLLFAGVHSKETNFAASCLFKRALRHRFKPPPPSKKKKTKHRAQPRVRRHVPASRVSVWLCNCFSICFFWSAVARCSPPAVQQPGADCRRWRGIPSIRSLSSRKNNTGPALRSGPLVQHTRDNQMIPFYTAY